ncbi:hypothetical protein ACIA6T_31290 [Streptomyces sp. NPDC051740]|uniref:hypothetical protein n=1 Tax=Streptomyces sp. NPDC051740 TaxID=3365673 RepID=UPI0037AA6F15
MSRVTWLRGAVRVVGGESKILKLLTCFTGVKTPGVRVVPEGAGTGERYVGSAGPVAGTGGTRSSVRRTVSGPHEDRPTQRNAMIRAFRLREQVPSFEASDSVVNARAGRAAWMPGFAGHAPTTLPAYRTGDIDEQFTGSRIERLRSVYAEARARTPGPRPSPVSASTVFRTSADPLSS